MFARVGREHIDMATQSSYFVAGRSVNAVGSDETRQTPFANPASNSMAQRLARTGVCGYSAGTLKEILRVLT